MPLTQESIRIIGILNSLDHPLPTFLTNKSLANSLKSVNGLAEQRSNLYRSNDITQQRQAPIHHSNHPAEQNAPLTQESIRIIGILNSLDHPLPETLTNESLANDLRIVNALAERRSNLTPGNAVTQQRQAPIPSSN